MELWRIPAFNEEGVRIMPLWQEDAASGDTVRAKAMG
jgi:hypothetical protein